jgi:outer membrane lipoprotein-sorting protein
MGYQRQLAISPFCTHWLTRLPYVWFFSSLVQFRVLKHRRQHISRNSSLAQRHLGRLQLACVLAAGLASASPALAGFEDARAFVPDARAIWERSLAAQRVGTVRGEAILRTVRRSGHATRLDISFIAKLDPDGWGRLLVSRIESGGPLQGSSFLTLDKQGAPPTQWLYLPALGSPRRISASSRGEGYFGSEFSHEGFLQPRLEDFEVKLLGDETVGGTRCWKIEAVPKNVVGDAAGHGKLLMWIRQDNAVERRILYYDDNGRPSKVMDAREVVPVADGGKWMVLRRRMHNLRSETVSVVSFRNIETGVDVDDAFFSPQHLSMQLW